MGKVRCSYVNGYHCDCYNRGVCESITYCTHQDNWGLSEENERLRGRIRQLEFENEKLKFELRQARESRDMWAEVPRQLEMTEGIMNDLGPIMSAEKILKIITSKE